jgi:hypothetical protein
MATKLKLEKGRMKFKNKSSPLKLLNQSQPNFAEIPMTISSKFSSY